MHNFCTCACKGAHLYFCVCIDVHVCVGAYTGVCDCVNVCVCTSVLCAHFCTSLRIYENLSMDVFACVTLHLCVPESLHIHMHIYLCL